MARRPAPGAASASPSKHVASFIAKFDPAIAKLVRAGRTKMRELFPTAVELVYDNYNALAIGWGPNERASEVIVSVAAYARGVSLYFTYGARLDDPDHLLQGAGNQGRFIRLERPAILDDPRVVSLIRAAERRGKSRVPAMGRGYTVIKSISAKQRPRRVRADSKER